MYFEVFSGIVSSYWLLILLFLCDCSLILIRRLWRWFWLFSSFSTLRNCLHSDTIYSPTLQYHCGYRKCFLCYRRGIYRWKKVLPLVFFSVPLSFLGGFLKISESLFYPLGIYIVICICFDVDIKACCSSKERH